MNKIDYDSTNEMTQKPMPSFDKLKPATVSIWSRKVDGNWEILSCTVTIFKDALKTISSRYSWRK